MNFTQLINSVSRDLTDFPKEQRTRKLAAVLLGKAIRANSNVQENNYTVRNFDFAVDRIIEKTSKS